MLTWTTVDLVPNANVIPGPHGEAVHTSPQLQLAQKYLWGLKGNAVILGKQTTQQLTVNIWLNDSIWEQLSDLYTYVTDYLDTFVGTFGRLDFTNDVNGYWPVVQPQYFADLIFLPYTLDTFRGQDTATPLQDQAGCLYTSGPGAGNKTWAQAMTLNFQQTIPGRTQQ